jgi:predicted Zn-dependent peptidase
METIPGIRSFCIGIWITVGSRNESVQKNGISHFLEHMFFRGTRTRSSKDIAIEIDSLGGELNAFTTRECTTFYSKVLDQHIPAAIELLTDILTHSTLEQEDIIREKEIILEEIRSVYDTPDDYIHELLSKAIWGEKGLGQCVLGTPETVSSFSQEDLLNHIKHYYKADNIIVAIAGNFDPDKVESLLNKGIGKAETDTQRTCFTPQPFQKGITILPRDLSEVHLCLGFKSLPLSHEKRYALYLLNSIVGSGMSSRLFQEIREKRGLAYSIYSYLSSYYDTGYLGVYVGTAKEKALTVIELILKELSLVKEGISAVELHKAQEQLKGNLILALESSTSRMSHIARQEIYFETYFSTTDIIKAIEAVTVGDVIDLANEILDGHHLAVSALGPLDEHELSSPLIDKRVSTFL